MSAIGIDVTVTDRLRAQENREVLYQTIEHGARSARALVLRFCYTTRQKTMVLRQSDHLKNVLEISFRMLPNHNENAKVTRNNFIFFACGVLETIKETNHPDVLI